MESLTTNARRVEEYLESKLMKLNVAKTQFMLVCTPPELCRNPLSISGGNVKYSGGF
jgi:hypothetical protein